MTRRLLMVMAAIAVAIGIEAGELFNGIVVDGSGKGVKGVKVWAADPDDYTKTDKKGHFGLSSVEPGDTLHVEYKKERYDIPVDGHFGLRVVITDAKTMIADPDEELVGYGYGWVKRREYNMPVDGIPGDRLRATGQTSLLKALAGLVPGLEISPGGRVTLRGHTSFMLDDQPLFIVDGTYVPDLDVIDVNVVDRVEILKEGSMYGARGANGAILVHTKRK